MAARQERERTFSALVPQGRESQNTHLRRVARTATDWPSAAGASGPGLLGPEGSLSGCESRTGRGGDADWKEAGRNSLASSSPLLLLEACTGVFERRRTRPPPPAPIQEAARLSAPAQGAQRLGAHVPRPLAGHYAAEQRSPSPPPPASPPAPPAARAAQLSAGGSVAQPSADGTLTARPQRLLKSKVGGRDRKSVV